jgi:hypothetical protein
MPSLESAACGCQKGEDKGMYLEIRGGGGAISPPPLVL